jgi:hypothetical protein
MRNNYTLLRTAAMAAATIGSLFFFLGTDDVHSETDELTQLGLPPDKGRDEVAAYCDACHSLKLVVQQGLSRAAWKETLEWMVEEQEMEPLETDEYKLVLDYLAKHVSIEARLKKRNQ